MARVEKLTGLIVFDHDKFVDNRGDLYTIWNDLEIDLHFNHDKVAKSNHKVLRGLHTDKSWKLITCLYGSIQLVVINFDRKSNEYLHWTDFILNSKDDQVKSILVPPGFLNGHLVLSEEAVFHYKWSYKGDYPDVSDQKSVKWDDQKIGINWLVQDPILSSRDASCAYID